MNDTKKPLDSPTAAPGDPTATWPLCDACGKSAREGRHCTDLGEGHDYVPRQEATGTQGAERVVREAVNACIDPSRGTIVGMAFEAVFQIAEALLDTRNGEDKGDGLPCWCPSPTWARTHHKTGGPGHSPRCTQCRAALSLLAPTVQP